jgi:hypothetical protein
MENALVIDDVRTDTTQDYAIGRWLSPAAILGLFTPYHIHIRARCHDTHPRRQTAHPHRLPIFRQVCSADRQSGLAPYELVCRVAV